jgi:hypothetical protein
MDLDIPAATLPLAAGCGFSCQLEIATCEEASTGPVFPYLVMTFPTISSLSGALIQCNQAAAYQSCVGLALLPYHLGAEKMNSPV